MHHSLLASAIAIGLLTTSLPVLSQNNKGFVEGATATLAARNFYINQDPRSGAGSPPKSEEWGQGFLLRFQSGYTPGLIGFGLDALGQAGVRLDAGGRAGKPDISRNPRAAFPLESDGSAVSNFSRIDFTGKVNISKTELFLGTLQPRLPVLTFNDGRLLPQTFRGGQITSRDISGLTFHIGQIEKASGRASSDYEELRVAGGSARVDQFRFAGGDYQLTDNLTTRYYFAELEDYYRQHFLGLVHNASPGKGKLNTDLRAFDSNAHGNNKDQNPLYGAAGFEDNGKVDNRALSALFTYSLSNHNFGLGYQHLSGNSHFPFINNGDGATAYLITDSQIGKFQRAGEKTWLARYGYDFASAGVPGLTATVSYLRGEDVDAAVSGADHEWERNVRVDYRVQDGWFKNLDLSLRHASLRSDVVGQRDQDEVRAIASYTFTLL